MLEPEVLKLSVPLHTEEDFSKAQSILEQYVNELALDDHVAGWVVSDSRHHQLLDLCRNRDIAVPCKLLREHIQHAGQSLKEALYERRKLAKKASEKD